MPTTRNNLSLEERRSLFARCYDHRGHKIPVTRAVHWLVKTKLNSPLARGTVQQIACGHAISESGGRTDDFRAVTCHACMVLAIREP